MMILLIKDGKKKIVYDAKATAENLMAAVTPGGDVVSARQAREEYTGDDKPFSDDFNTDKDERPASNSGTGFMNTTTTVNGKIVPVTIADAFAKITIYTLAYVFSEQHLTLSFDAWIKRYLLRP